MAIQTASTYFDTIATEYDALARRAMPRYGEMLDEIVRCLPERAERILELGCGTGALTERLAERYPDAKITAVDGSPAMVAIARRRLDRKPLTTFLISPFEELELSEEGFDLIASNISLHHVEEKVAFYARLRRALTLRGTLVLGDELVADVPYVQQRNWDDWLAFARANGVTEPEIEETIEHMERFDHYETLPAQLALLSGAGFLKVDCVWRYQNYAVFVAKAT